MDDRHADDRHADRHVRQRVSGPSEPYTSPEREPQPSQPEPQPSQPELDQYQRHAFDLALTGRDMFLTGGPGTGKSHTLTRIVEALEIKMPGGVLVTAPTGVAALLLGGQTLHQSPGPGIPGGSTKAFGNMCGRKAEEKWGRTRVLVIDEVSMADAEFLDWYFTRVPKRIQLIACGDFSQLPPVPDKQGSLDNAAHLRSCVRAARRLDCEENGRPREPDISAGVVDDGGWLAADQATPFGLKETTGHYAFQSAMWRNRDPAVVQLRHVHRTRDALLLSALDDMRQGRDDTSAVRDLVAATSRPLVTADGIAPTVLYPLRKSVADENLASLHRLPADGPAHRQVYTARDDVVLDDRADAWAEESLHKDAFFTRDCQAAAKFELRVGAQVPVRSPYFVEAPFSSPPASSR